MISTPLLGTQHPRKRVHNKTHHVSVQHAYSRRADVINRGFSGYNTVMVLKILDDILDTLPCAKVCVVCLRFAPVLSVPPGEYACCTD